MPERIGHRIQQIRKKKSLSQEDLAEKANLNSTYLGHIEQGRREPRFKTLKKIAAALNVMVKDLIPF